MTRRSLNSVLTGTQCISTERGREEGGRTQHRKCYQLCPLTDRSVARRRGGGTQRDRRKALSLSRDGHTCDRAPGTRGVWFIDDIIMM